MYQIVNSYIQSDTPPFHLGYLHKICGSKQPLGTPDLLDKCFATTLQVDIKHLSNKCQAYVACLVFVKCHQHLE